MTEVYTAEFWAARKRAGRIRARYVGLLGAGNDMVRIIRVTRSAVHVRGEHGEFPAHPDDLRPA